ncbi:RUN and FYVE domain-containing protein 4 [Alligator mississippiensis]|uniref:RUN and FYVE domain-containing protein 4 n=1 Tax=Alligator mississippiensis TaxID=8496 RepID=UPI0007119DF1|nr:RUN and FYVE domain-containing protein 4 [Alligator mississippiensis]
MPGATELQRVLADLRGTVSALTRGYRDQGRPVTDGSPELLALCARLEFLLQFDLKEKRSLWGQRQDYWDFLCQGLRGRHEHQGITHVRHLPQLRTPLGRGRALLRYCLARRQLAETLQLCLLDPQATRAWYHARSPFLDPQLCADLLACLYDLDGVAFCLDPQPPGLDAGWPPSTARSPPSCQDQPYQAVDPQQPPDTGSRTREEPKSPEPDPRAPLPYPASQGPSLQPSTCPGPDTSATGPGDHAAAPVPGALVAVGAQEPGEAEAEATGLRQALAGVQAELGRVREQLVTLSTQHGALLEGLAQALAQLELPGTPGEGTEMLEHLCAHLVEARASAQRHEQELRAREDELSRCQQDVQRLAQAEHEALAREQAAREELGRQREVEREVKGRLLELLREKDSLWQQSEGIGAPPAPGPCARCRSTAGPLARRHQCRVCGRAVCQACSVDSVRGEWRCLSCSQARSPQGP